MERGATDHGAVGVAPGIAGAVLGRVHGRRELWSQALQPVGALGHRVGQLLDHWLAVSCKASMTRVDNNSRQLARLISWLPDTQCLLERIPKTQTRESRETTVGASHLQTMLNCQSRQLGIGDVITGRNG